jgi:phosphatidyl-myo-inositol dimannoside synthase
MATRVLALVGDCYGGPGGIARYNQDLFEALASGGAEVLILPRLGRAQGLGLPAGITQFPPMRGKLGFLVMALWHVWRRRPVDIVFCGHLYMAPIAWAVARFAGARCWMQVHGAEVWIGRRKVVRRALEAADMVTSVSRGTRRILMSWADLAPERVRVLPDTVRDAFVPGPRPAAMAERLKLGPGPILLTVGRLSASERYKGHELIFAALPTLRAHFPMIVHVVAGDGDDRARLEQRARELTCNAADAVRFLGFVPEEELPDLYRLSDLYVMPSSQEGFGIVYLEAAACGLRVVGGVGGGSADAVPDERVGVLVDAADAEALAAAIIRLLRQGRADPAAVEPYRRRHFNEVARQLLARLSASPRRMTATATS